MIAASLILALFASSCKKDDKDDTSINSNGVFITNEGAYGKGNGSVSYYNPDKNTVENDYFSIVNGRSLGDVVQSMYIDSDKGYIVVNNSGKVEIVNMKDFKSTGVIENLSQPRFLTVINDTKAYVTCWGNSGEVAVIDLTDNTLTKSIPVGSGPEQLIKSGNNVYVCNSGGFATDNTISVINSQTDELVTTITVGDNPSDIVSDSEGYLWALCKGAVVWNADYTAIESQTQSQLVRIDPTGNISVKGINISETLHPAHLAIGKDKQTLYYGGGFNFSGIYSIKTSDTHISEALFSDKSFYGFAVNPETGNFYGFLAPSFETAGTMYRYTSTGTAIDKITLGIGPNGASFR